MAFDKVKEHIKGLRTEISRLNEGLEEIREEIKTLKEAPKLENKPHKDEISEPISTGNKGVSSLNTSLTHSLPHSQFTHSLGSFTPSLIPGEDDNTKPEQKKPLEDTFYSLTKKEFELFLLIYQLEEENTMVSYSELAKRLTLTSGATRSYVSSIIKKGCPLIKKILKNKAVILSIEPEFKAIASREKLINMYYTNIDPFQTKLTRD